MGFLSKLVGMKKEEEIVFKNNRDEFLHKCKGWGKKDYEAYIEKFDSTAIAVIDLTKRAWGRSFALSPMKGNDWLYTTMGWYSNPRIKAGDYIKASTPKGNVRLQVVAIDYEKDPHDIFFGILVNHGKWIDEEEK